MSPEEKIRAKLAGVRARLNRAGMAEACAVGVMTLSFSLAITILVAAVAGPTWAHWSIAPLSIGVWATWLFVWRLWLLPRRKLSSDEAVARWCEAKFEETGADLITAVQLQDAKNPTHSPALSRAVISRAAHHLTTQDWTKVGTQRRHSWLGAMGALSFIFLLALGLLFPRVINQAYANLFEPPPNSPTSAGLEIVERASVVEDEAVDIQSPTYTGLAMRRIVEHGRIGLNWLDGADRWKVRFLRQGLLILESDPGDVGPLCLVQTMLSRQPFELVSPIGTGCCGWPRWPCHVETVWRDVIAEADASLTSVAQAHI